LASGPLLGPILARTLLKLLRNLSASTALGNGC
jgi:hypothetical protein